MLMRWESSIVVSCGRVELMGDGGQMQVVVKSRCSCGEVGCSKGIMVIMSLTAFRVYFL